MASGLVFPKHVVLEFMIVLLTLLATLQLTFALMRAAFLATSASERRGRLLGVLYAVFLCLDFVVMAAVCVSGAYGGPLFVLEFFSLRAPLMVLMWAVAPSMAVACMQVVLLRRPLLLCDVVVLLAVLPPVAQELGPLWPFALILMVAYFVGRGVGDAGELLRLRKLGLTRFSPGEALGVVTEGMLCTRDDGRVLFMNDAMRSCLGELGLPLDLGDFRDLWERIVSLAAGGARSTDGAKRGVRIRISADETRYFTCEPLSTRHKGRCIIAYDISERDQLDRRLERTGKGLERAGTELAESLQRVQEVARIQASLHMRSRVHDVIGQRVSILHRYLEDDQLPDETVATLEPLLVGILDDLRVHEADDPQASLAAVIAAFELVGVRFCVTGSLPADDEVAGLFVRVIREASTNALHHGQAHTIWLSMDQTARSAHLSVENDGTVPAAVRERGGIAGIRRRVANAGGSLSINREPRFSIHVEVPLAR